MPDIELTGPRDKRHLVAGRVLSEADFRALARELGVTPLKARKTGLIAARRAQQPERIDTRWNGSETINTAEPGDWIVTSLSAEGKVLRDKAGNANSYVIRAGTFPTLYQPAVGPVQGETAFGRIHAAIGTVEVLHLPGGFDIVGPWGKPQTALDGYLVLNGSEVYGNNVETFAASFEVLA